SAGVGAAVRVIASGLPAITAMAELPAGGLVALEDASIRLFSNDGLGEITYQGVAGTRVAALAADPRFQETGFVYAAQTRRTPEGEEISVVRHRLLAGVLGE